MLGMLEAALAIGNFLKSRAFGAALLVFALSFAIGKSAQLAQAPELSPDGVSQLSLERERKDPEHRILLAFDAGDLSQLEGKLDSGEDGQKPGEDAPETAEDPETDAGEEDPGFTFKVVDGGEERILRTKGGTVKNALEHAGIVLGENDEVDPSLDQELSPGMEIRVTRREYVTRQIEEAIPFESVKQYSTDLKPGKIQVASPGEEGIRLLTYTVEVVDGEPVFKTLEEEEVVKEPVEAVYQVGFRAEPVSAYDFHWEFDEDGEPLEYKSVLRSVKAAGYTAGSGARTATGLPAKVGHVAVNPSQIPYGSKLYIESSDGKFVYGYAIAADTGSALKNGIIDVDLFFSTYEECRQNGIRKVNIYILD